MSSFLQNIFSRVARFFGLSVPAFESNPEAEQSALRAARRWLSLVDAHDYGESWEQAATLFQKGVTKEDWVEKTTGLRNPLGNKIERNVRSARYATSIPGAPDGEYVIMQFETEFENKEKAVETVTFVKENGNWKATGYFFK